MLFYTKQHYIASQMRSDKTVLILNNINILSFYYQNKNKEATNSFILY